MATNFDTVSVASVLPFWRYAVGPTSQHSPAVPFWSQVEAKAFFREAARAMPFAAVSLYKRRGLRGIEETDKTRRAT